MIARLKREPALVVNFVLALLAFLVGRGWVSQSLSSDLANLLTVGLPLLTVGAGVAIRQVVTPVTEVTRQVTDTATEVGVEVARQLGPTVVGTVGEVTGAARGIVGDVVDAVVPGR